MKTIAKKLRRRLGETIAETLVALLVASLALMMLAGMIAATTRTVKLSEDKMDEYYEENVKLQNIGTTKTYSGSITLDGTAISVPVVYDENKTFKDTVTAYKYAGPAAGGTGD